MLDTVKLESPPLSESLASESERSLVRRQGIEVGTGEVLYEITAGSLEGSYDSRVSLRVQRERIVCDEITGQRELRPCAPYLWLEGSPHKAMLGHNIEGGPEDVQAACRWFVADVASRLSVRLPDGLGWLVRRLDWSEVFRLPYEACEGYIWAMNQARYSRRQPLRFGEQTIMFPGSTTAHKLYHKGPEFSAHDHKRLAAFLGPDEAGALQRVANERLRVETSVKARKLTYDFGNLPRVREVDAEYMRNVHDRELGRILREGDGEMKTVRKHRDVRDRLRQLHGERLGAVLFGTWTQLVMMGEGETRKGLTRPTFYRHRKLLKDSGVSWLGSDVFTLPDSLIPADFVPRRSDPRHVGGEDPEVSRKLAPFRAA